MNLDFQTLKDKILGCWNGKNIGGVLGAPFELKRGTFDTNFYVQENLEGNPPPNDDLDLQLVWLAAAEKYGRQLNADILAEYWLTFITPDWAEYGRGKANLRAGMQPPLSGHVENVYHNSCGCFIRSEIWACLCPGLPDLAVHYAYEDAVVDHSEDGLYGELFCAALESAAFVESDRNKLIEIGLSYIPDNCLVAKSVRLAMECHKSGISWKEARIRMMNEVPGTFGLQSHNIEDNTENFPTTPLANDAPNNIGLMMIGWLYGESDFGKSLCIAVNCGEDADCTAGTLGAIMGIIHGNNNLPSKWTSPIGGIINTLCINPTKEYMLGGIPKTVEELSDRILRNIPRFLDPKTCDLFANNGFSIKTQENLFCPARNDQNLAGIGNIWGPSSIWNEDFGPLTIKKDFPIFRAYLDHLDSVYLQANIPKKLIFTVYGSEIAAQQWINIQIYVPDYVKVLPGKSLGAPLQCTFKTSSIVEITLLAETIPASKTDILIDISLVGRHSSGLIKTTLYTK